MKSQSIRLVTLLALCGVIVLSASVLGGQSATNTRGSGTSVAAAVERPAPAGWLIQTLRVQLRLWFGISLEPAPVKVAPPAVTTPKDDGPVKSQTGPNKPNIWEVAADNGGDGVVH